MNKINLIKKLIITINEFKTKKSYTNLSSIKKDLEEITKHNDFKDFKYYIPYLENLIFLYILDHNDNHDFIVDLTNITDKNNVELEIFKVDLMIENLLEELNSKKYLIILKNNLPQQNGGDNEYYKIIEHIRNFI